ncbi:MAG: hypothetical protein HYS45_01395 [Parcubacteria group bacterium]|nr:hypothetical protein [Parcubacteria group bacterium]
MISAVRASPKGQGTSLAFPFCLTRVPDYLYNERMQAVSEPSANQEVLSYLRRAASQNTLAHAHALIGPQSSGRMELVKDFLRDFIPARTLAHPDVRILEPEGEVITIGAVRLARLWLSMTPIAADKKALIINRASAMNTEAQNALLTVLEEPAKDTYLFLLASHRKQMLPTIYSRVVPLYCVPLPGEEQNTAPGHLIHSVLAADTASERMRLWLSAAIPKEEMRSWLSAALPRLREELRSKRSGALGTAVRNLIAAQACPSGQNWQLVAERLIISL